MLKLEFIVPCQQIIQDSHTNMMSYINILEGLRVKASEVTLPPIFFGLRWVRDISENDTQFEAQLKVIDPEGKQISDVEPFKIKMNRRWHRQNVVIHNLNFKIPGDYKIIVEQKDNSDWSIVGETIISLEVLSD